MARDRQRAKQRRRKRNAAAPPPVGADARAGADPEELLEEIAFETGAPPQDLGVGAGHDIGDEEELDDDAQLGPEHLTEAEVEAELAAEDAEEEEVVGGEGADELEVEIAP